MNMTDPENIIGKIEMFIEDLERYAKEDKETVREHPFTDRLNGYYTGRAEVYAFTARWLRAYMEGNA